MDSCLSSELSPVTAQNKGIHLLWSASDTTTKLRMFQVTTYTCRCRRSNKNELRSYSTDWGTLVICTSLLIHWSAKLSYLMKSNTSVKWQTTHFKAISFPAIVLSQRFIVTGTSANLTVVSAVWACIKKSRIRSEPLQTLAETISPNSTKPQMSLVRTLMAQVGTDFHHIPSVKCQ